jgi:hypothetical protein
MTFRRMLSGQVEITARSDDDEPMLVAAPKGKLPFSVPRQYPAQEAPSASGHCPSVIFARGELRFQGRLAKWHRV